MSPTRTIFGKGPSMKRIGEAARARTRESIYRQILPAIEAYGDSSDFPRLLRLIKLKPLVPTKPTDPYRQASCDQALGTYLKLARMNPASFLVNAKGYAPYYNYSFIDNSSRIEGMERFFRRIDLLSSQEMPPHESLELEQTNGWIVFFPTKIQGTTKRIWVFFINL